jgi:hypothetical protein
MGTHDSAIHEDFLQVGVVGYVPMQVRPHPALGPTREALEHTVPVAQLRWQQTPLRSTHSTAFRNRRHASGCPTYTRGCAAKNAQIATHCSSVKTTRFMTHLKKPQKVPAEQRNVNRT